MKRECEIDMIKTELSSQTIKDVLNGVCISVKNIIPLHLQISKPSLFGQSLQIQNGVLIGMIGDVSGRILFSADRNVFSSIGESMFGMVIEGEMLSSFSGELGNMIAANISSHIASQGITSDITSPTVMEGNTKFSGFEKAFFINVTCENAGELHIYVMLD